MLAGHRAGKKGKERPEDERERAATVEKLSGSPSAQSGEKKYVQRKGGIEENHQLSIKERRDIAYSKVSGG